jgi:hypothetical protein
MSVIVTHTYTYLSRLFYGDGGLAHVLPVPLVVPEVPVEFVPPVLREDAPPVSHS